MAAKVWPAQGNGAPLPTDLGLDAIAALAYTLNSSDRTSPLISTRRGDWSLVAFVTGAATNREARDAVTAWLGVKRAAVMVTKVGGQAAKLEVTVEDPQPAPTRTTRDYDPALDEPAANLPA